MEALEARLTLTSNVVAKVLGGNLTVTGNDEGADIAISQTRPGVFKLVGNGTLINGLDRAAIVRNVTRDVLIKFGNGDDTLSFDQTNPISVPGNLSIQGGRGLNQVLTTTLLDSPGALNVGKNLSIVNLTGTFASVDLAHLNVKGDLQIVNLADNALVAIGDSAAMPSATPINTVHGNLQISNGPGAVDQNTLSSIHVEGNVQIVNLAAAATTTFAFGDTQNRIVKNLQIINGADKSGDNYILNTIVGGKLQVLKNGDGHIAGASGLSTAFVNRTPISKGAAGQNNIAIVSSAIGKDIFWQGGRSEDRVIVADSSFRGAFELESGDGADTVEIGAGQEFAYTIYKPVFETRTREVRRNGQTFTVNYVVAHLVPESRIRSIDDGPSVFNRNVSADLGDGDDVLRLATTANVIFNASATFDGKAGTNTAELHNASLPNAPTLIRFVPFVPPPIVLTDDDASPLGDGRASALAAVVDADGRIQLTVSGYPDFDGTGAHTLSGDFKLYVRLGEADFSNFDPLVFDFEFSGTLVPGAANTFEITGQTVGTPFIAWIDNTVGASAPDTVLRFEGRQPGPPDGPA